MISQHTEKPSQSCTFHLDKNLYCLDVTAVQEVIKVLPVTPIPLLPDYLKGLINLRGQIVTAVDLRVLFGMQESSCSEKMCVICQWEGHLFGLIVDEIGDVFDTDRTSTTVSEALPEQLRVFIKYVHKTPSALIAEINLEKVFHHVDELLAMPVSVTDRHSRHQFL